MYSKDQEKGREMPYEMLNGTIEVIGNLQSTFKYMFMAIINRYKDTFNSPSFVSTAICIYMCYRYHLLVQLKQSCLS